MMQVDNKILELLQVLDQFAAEAPLSRQWHIEWQERFKQVAFKIQKVMKQEQEKEEGPDA
jgi:hypothetical protein